MAADWPAREKECDNCNVIERLRQVDGFCAKCKMAGELKDGFRSVGLEERFPAEFRGWVNELMRIANWKDAGFDIGTLALGFEEWEALVTIRAFYAERAQQNESRGPV